MMEIVASPGEFPAGSHALGFYSSRAEAARNMASFLKGAQERDQEAIVLTADDEMAKLYRDAVEREVPQLLGVIHRIPGPHVRSTGDGLRPVQEVLDFAANHPGGATMSGDTLPGLLNRSTLPNILVYEDWFDSLRPFYHRGLCPYDLNHIPVDRAPEAFSRLAQAHTHGVLSNDPDPSAQFLQLLILPAIENPPETHLGWLARAVDNGLIREDQEEGKAAGLTPRGETFVRALRAFPAISRRRPRTARDRETRIDRGAPEPGFPQSSPEE